ARAVAARDTEGRAQIVYYSAGVGASLDGFSLWQGMTAEDLDDHLISAYQFLTLNYEPGDELFLFGFSRGAYTVRSLSGLLRKCGILRRAHADKAEAALALYRKIDLRVDHPEAVAFREAHAAAWPQLDAMGLHQVAARGPDAPRDLRIRYIGVWDTVGSLGIPRMLPVSLGFNRQYEFHDTALSRAVDYARHAVAIDEKRPAFAPTLWNNVHRFNREGERPRVLQTWFPGDHGCVGGGGVGEARLLSNCALLWILEGAEEAGLALAREPGSVLSACMAELDPVNGGLRARGEAFNIMNYLGARWRRGLSDFSDINETARLRWIADPRYRPLPLSRYRRRFDQMMNELVR
ncbi:MAG: DUF2235 domain-containing protein, partial [Hyphomonadaceae bacterium]